MEDFKEQKTALGYVMESRITSKCGFFPFGYVMGSRIINRGGIGGTV